MRYAFKTARQAGGIVKFVRALASRNACKTCALGMGGQRGGMVDERAHFPEVCKKSMQAMAADMQAGIPAELFSRYTIKELGSLSPREAEQLGRLTTPLRAGPGDAHYQPIGWGEAIRRCVERLVATPPEQSFFYCSGRSSNEAAFILQLFARLYGTNNVNNCSYYCHQASGVGLTSALGTGTATITLEDLTGCDMIFLIGGNPASNHPRLMRQLMHLRRRGGQVVVINPLKETGLVRFSVPSDLRSLLSGSEIASVYIQPHIGGDLALLTGIQKHLLESNAIARSFIDTCTEGFPAFRESVQETAWQAIEAGSGVDRDTIAGVADLYLRSERTVFAWTMGITHHRHGSDNVRAIVNTALCRGMIGRQGAGMLPIRGHSNVQGVGSVGVTPALKKAVFARLESHFGVKLPTSNGLDTLACMEAMACGTLTAGWCLGGNLYGANPDSTFAADAMRKMESLCYFSTTLNPGHFLGRAAETLILPMLVRDEEPQPTTQESMFNFVRLSDGGPRRHEGPRSEVAVIATIARGVLGDDGPIDWQSMQRHGRIREAIAAVVPGYEAIGRIDRTKHEFQIAGRTFHTPRFKTESGKAKFHVTPLPKLNGGAGQLRLMTIRSEGQFNTVVYEEHDLYRHQDRRDVILMNRDDIDRLGLAVDQAVTVIGEAGSLSGILVRAFDIPPGNAAMYFPEANVLVSRAVDPESRTPAFKGAVVTLTPDPTKQRT
ncbi:MAG: FdhF/YdeP family oxidoreductase [Phycisphaerae bacterium]